MKKIVAVLLCGGLLMPLNAVLADQHEGEEGEANVARPVEMYACQYMDGKGPSDLEAVIKKFNAWADKQDIDDYWAWTMVPYYFGPEQEFDFLWLGASPTAKALGENQEAWLGTGGKVQGEFAEVFSCNQHGNYAVLRMKEPPKREDPSRGVVAFSDCSMTEGTTFDDMYPAIMEWGKYTAEQGSKAGMFVFFPAFGGGGESFDFKWVNSHQDLAELGVDYDNYSETGWEKANELFQGKLNCDSSRAYLSTTRRMPKGDDE